MLKSILLVGIGGGFGSVLRYLASIYLTNEHQSFPWPTFLVNLVGSFLIGLLIGHFQKSSNDQLSLLLVMGFCGGFTTFSTFSKECLSFIQHQQIVYFLAYLLLSLVLCILATAAGLFMIK